MEHSGFTLYDFFVKEGKYQFDLPLHMSASNSLHMPYRIHSFPDLSYFSEQNHRLQGIRLNYSIL